jgi:hypothetical protein
MSTAATAPEAPSAGTCPRPMKADTAQWAADAKTPEAR